MQVSVQQAQWLTLNVLQQCSRCRTVLDPIHFISTNGKSKCKTCTNCRNYDKNQRDVHKCHHGRNKYRCKDCGGKSLCEHQRIRSRCKDCKGGSICLHGRIRSQCKECIGGGICIHRNIRTVCIECKGGGICIHDKIRTGCKDCHGSAFCLHGVKKYTCKDCNGTGICEHNRRKTRCKDCKGNSICNHNKLRSRCVDCGGSEICLHKCRKSQCKICDPDGHLIGIVRKRVHSALKRSKTLRSIEYLGCSIQYFRAHITSLLKEGMSWDNYGEWEIDHVIPLLYNDPSIEEIIPRLHWSNTQPMWKNENAAKGNRFIG